MSVTLNAIPKIFCHPSSEISDTAPNPRCGGGGVVVESRSPDSPHQEVPEEIPPLLWPSRRERRAQRLSSPACRSCHIHSLAAPFPLYAGRKRLPPVSPTARSRKKGRMETGKRSRDGEVFEREGSGNGKRGGVLRLHGNRG